MDGHPTAGWTVDVRAIRNPWARRTSVGIGEASPPPTNQTTMTAGATNDKPANVDGGVGSATPPCGHGAGPA